MPQFALTRSDLAAFMEALRGFHTAFRPCLTRQEPRDPCVNSMVGQCRARERTSIAPMALPVAGGTGRARQRLGSDALWDADPMRATEHRWVQDKMGEPDSVLLIAETGCVKKGQDAVGVARQDCGALGKVAPCQVGLFAAEASRQGDALVDKRLCSPEAWFPAA